MFRLTYLTSALLGSLFLVASLAVVNVRAQTVRTETVTYVPPTLTITSDQAVVKACLGSATANVVHLNAKSVSADGSPITYRWRSDVGRLDGTGPTATWDLSGVKPGYYQAYVEVDTGSAVKLCQAFSSTAVLVECPPALPPPCPKVSISCPVDIVVGQTATFTSVTSGISGNIAPTYNWITSGGVIVEGQGSSSIRVDTTGLEGQTLTATLSLGGFNLDCSASCSVQLPIPVACRSFDEFPEISRNEEKARLDNFAIELQNDPSVTGYVLINPAAGRAVQARNRSVSIVDYLVNSRGLDSRRIVTLIGPYQSETMIHLSVCPPGLRPK